nr:hypothetical protein Iba_chr12dCG1680 [Ipomoea batatas]
MPETPMSLCWHHSQLDLLCLWFTWPQFRSPAQALTRLGVLELLSSMAKTRPGMTNGYSGLDHLLELLLLHCTTSMY